MTYRRCGGLREWTAITFGLDPVLWVYLRWVFLYSDDPGLD